MNGTFSLKQYSRVLFIVTFATIILTETVFFVWLKEYSFPSLIMPILILWLTTLGGHLVLRRALGKSPQSFVRTFMLATTVKLFVYLLFMLLYCYFYRAHAVPFLLTFVSGYFIFGVLDVVTTLIFLKNSGHSNNQPQK